jgi:hypothetical protein
MRLFVSHKTKRAAGAEGEPAQKAKPVPPEKLKQAATGKVPEIGGPEGPEPTRYGDWERKGIASDF